VLTQVAEEAAELAIGGIVPLRGNLLQVGITNRRRQQAMIPKFIQC
jgi:hypothetical protein